MGNTTIFDSKMIISDNFFIVSCARNAQVTVYTRHLNKAGQTARPIGQTFFCGHLWVAGELNKIEIIFLISIFFEYFFPRARLGPSASDL